jgi:hypothetical protein
MERTMARHARSGLVGAVCALLTFFACKTGSPNTIAGAATVTTAALGASMAERAAGGCFAMCTNGTFCNPRSGLCEVAPCRNSCSADEHCEATPTGERCAPGGTGVTAQGPGTKSNIPVLPPPVFNPPGTPTITPAAEQQPPSSK